MTAREIWALGLSLALALAYAIPSFAYPWGGDAAIFQYIGAAWRDGIWPYEGAVEHKPPGIFALYAVSSALFDRAPWGVRPFELGALLVSSGCIARMCPRRATALGTSVVVLSGLYFTLFGYWSLGQVELWEGMFLLAAWSATRDGARPGWGGALTAAAVVFKFPAILPALGVLAIGAWRAPGSRARFVGVFVASGLAVGTCVLLPFAWRGSLGTLYEALIPFNVFYLAAERWRPEASPSHFLRTTAVAFVAVTVVVGLGAFARAIERRESPRLLLEGALMLGLTFGSIAIQQKFLMYHWVVLVPFWAAFLTFSVGTFVRDPLIGAGAAALWVALAFLFSPSIEDPRRPGGTSYRSHVAAWLWPAPRSRDYPPRFAFLYVAADQQRISDAILAAARPDETLCVVGGYGPSVYALTGLRCPSRFFSDHVIEYLDRNRALAGELARWVDEHHETLRAHPPDWIVVRDPDTAPPGYVTHARSGPWTAQRRGGPGLRPAGVSGFEGPARDR